MNPKEETAGIIFCAALKMMLEHVSYETIIESIKIFRMKETN